MTSEKFLRHVDDPDVASIPTSPQALVEAAKSFSPDNLAEFTSPTVLTLVQQEFMGWHDSLGHMGMKEMLHFQRRVFS